MVKKKRPDKPTLPAPGASPEAASDNERYVVKVDEDGRTHHAVPLKGPRHKEGQPFLVAHYSMPPPAEQKALIGRLAEILARAAFERMLKEGQVAYDSGSSPPPAGGGRGETAGINTPESRSRRTQRGRKKASVHVPSKKDEGSDRSR